MFGWLWKHTGKPAPKTEVMPKPERSHGLVDLTDWERGYIQRTVGKCPDCEIGDLCPGPRGGMSVNVLCDSCSARFNLAVVEGQVLFAQRIGEGDTAER